MYIGTLPSVRFVKSSETHPPHPTPPHPPLPKGDRRAVYPPPRRRKNRDAGTEFRCGKSICLSAVQLTPLYVYVQLSIEVHTYATYIQYIQYTYTWPN